MQADQECHIAGVGLKVVYMNAVGLAVNGKELEFIDYIGEIEPDIIGVVETVLTKKSHLIFLKACMVLRKDREGFSQFEKRQPKVSGPSDEQWSF